MKTTTGCRLTLVVLMFFMTVFGGALGHGQPMAPTITSVTGIGNRVEVVFSVPVEATSAVSLANYSVSNYFGNVTVQGAVFGTNTQTIELTTAAQLPFMAHWLTVSRRGGRTDRHQRHCVRLPGRFYQHRVHDWL